MLARHNEVVRDDYEALRKRYDEVLASHSQAITKLELAQDENNRLTKKCDELTQERNNVVSFITANAMEFSQIISSKVSVAFALYPFYQ